MVLTNDYYQIDSKTNTVLANELLQYLATHPVGTDIREILNFFGGKYTNWEIKKTVMQLISAQKIRLASDTTLKIRDS